MLLVSDCQPENGCYGFHLFGNIEELLPVLRRRKRRLAYYLVGNLNTETYPASANLPAYVTEYYRLSNNPDSVTTLYDNLDRIIISLRVGTRVVETVYVTEHDMFVSGRFSPDNTHEVSPALIRALQSPELDLSTFLTHMGYYQGMQVARVEDIGQIHNQELSAQQILDLLQSYSGYSAIGQQIYVNTTSSSYGQDVQYDFNLTSAYNQYIPDYGVVWYDYRRSRAVTGARASVHGFGLSAWEWSDPGSDDWTNKWKECGILAAKVILCMGAVYLAAKGLSWLRSCWSVDSHGKSFRTMSRIRPPLQTHIMLDYVY
ncbi:uncharacterized protein LOC115376216 [Myripristis murdjan]|uniref:uncharacterized protein LOC115376216 n=1 Tax=Myripristis murdjan TaxID=586833 RepID=UPI001175F422|nr:uncharacterized protein LOC115376216 [Myripristis murdjan]